jgi:transposase
VPFRVTYGSGKDKRPDLKPCVLSLLGVDRTVPMWGKPEDGHASDKTLNTTLLSEIPTILARHGVTPGAYINVADAALVTEDNLAALEKTLCISRLPATSTAGRGRLFRVADQCPLRGRSGPSRRDVLKGYKNQYGIEQNFRFLKDSLMVNRLCLNKPERIEAVGLVLWLALLLWRLMERSLRHDVDTTGSPVTGWDKKATDRPTTFMMVTKFSGLIVVTVDEQRYLARTLSSVQQPYLTALSVPATCFTTPTRG